MKEQTKEALERIRNGREWPDDDLLVVIHVTQKDKPKIEKLLQEMELKDGDAVEVVPE